MVDLAWKLSHWDRRVHAFPTIGDIVSEAVCQHSALTPRLTEPTDDDRRCQACLLLHGDELADRYGDADRYAL